MGVIVSLHVGVVLLFAAVYYNFDLARVASETGVGTRLSHGDALWYSLVTQSTVGYGDLLAKSGLGRAVAGVQMLGSLVELALLSAVIIGRVLGPDRDSVRIDSFITFDPRHGRFAFRFLNVGHTQYSDVSIQVSTRLNIEDSPHAVDIRMRDRPLLVMDVGFPYTRTSSPCDIACEPVETDSASMVLHPSQIGREITVLNIVLTGQTMFRAGVHRVTREAHGQVVCGRFVAMARPNGGVDRSQFGVTEATAAVYCLGNCKYRPSCNLQNKVMPAILAGGSPLTVADDNPRGCT